MTRNRIAVGILAPAPLGTLLLVTVAKLFGPKPLYWEELLLLPLGILAGSLVAYLIVGAQSVVYAFLMEYVNRRLRSDAAVLACGAALGAIAAVPVLALFPKREAGLVIHMLVIAAVVGLVVSYILRRMYRRGAMLTSNGSTP